VLPALPDVPLREALLLLPDLPATALVAGDRALWEPALAAWGVQPVTGAVKFYRMCYTGAVSVHAGLGGARTTTSVDLSPTYLEWAARNLARNGLTGARHRLVQADALAWLEAEQAQYDLVFCDPPTFSNSKRAEDFDTQRDHVRLLRAAVARLAPRGLLLFSNNYRRFRLDDEAVAQFATVREISPQTLDPDFERNPRIHRAWEVRSA